MLTFGQSILIAILSSGLTSVIIGGLFTFFVNKRLDRYQRIMGERKDIYSKVHEELAGFFDYATIEARQKASKELLVLYRQIQIWGAIDVIKQFNKFLDAFNKENNRPTKEINSEYTKLVMAMKKDLTGEDIDEGEVRRYGKINI